MRAFECHRLLAEAGRDFFYVVCGCLDEPGLDERIVQVVVDCGRSVGRVTVGLCVLYPRGREDRGVLRPLTRSRMFFRYAHSRLAVVALSAPGLRGARVPGCACLPWLFGRGGVFPVGGCAIVRVSGRGL
ncbi:hypothetical protein [Streptomyces sp. 8L]|uniref:hypothetical protein n=1 Tax=Streptomyces sp. 8L TaxID=2877242 RepID=UPI001CD2AD91|nr:hypothetical protein [Streptomyces sp. 8L]MCA1223586.1 hypothetical protein [Streptomyces sp. 8L]